MRLSNASEMRAVDSRETKRQAYLYCPEIFVKAATSSIFHYEFAVCHATTIDRAALVSTVALPCISTPSKLAFELLFPGYMTELDQMNW